MGRFEYLACSLVLLFVGGCVNKGHRPSGASSLTGPAEIKCSDEHFEFEVALNLPEPELHMRQLERGEDMETFRPRVEVTNQQEEGTFRYSFFFEREGAPELLTVVAPAGKAQGNGDYRYNGGETSVALPCQLF